MPIPTKLPAHLHPAYDWTSAAGEIAELRDADGEYLDEYVRQSVDNAVECEGPETDVTEGGIRDLAAWLKAQP